MIKKVQTEYYVELDSLQDMFTIIHNNECDEDTHVIVKISDCYRNIDDAIEYFSEIKNNLILFKQQMNNGK